MAISTCQSIRDTYPETFPEHQSGKTMRSSGSVTWYAPDESFIHNGYLKEVFGKRSGLKIVVIGLADAAEEAHWAREAQFEMQHAQHESLCLKDLIDVVTAINHVHDLLD